MENKTIAKIFIWSSVIVFSVFLMRILIDGYTFWSSTDIKYDVTGQIGDFVGGIIGTIISAAGFYFLYLTFNDQRNAFEKERLESKYFDLIKLHRDNVSELKFDATNLKDNHDSLFIEAMLYEGKSVFKVIFNQFIMCKNELRIFFKKTPIYTVEYEKQLLKDPYIIKNNIDIDLLAKIDICYSIVFYGLSSEGLLILNEIFKEKYRPELIGKILRYISLKPANDPDILKKWIAINKKSTKKDRIRAVELVYNWRRFKKRPSEEDLADVVENYHNMYTKYYGGHQFRLGHYYRHLFHTVKFINNQKNIDYPTKYEYIKILRAQLSTYEQAVLFTNSLSKMGKSWELKPEIDSKLEGFSKHDFELITKYNLIKNLPGDYIFGIPFKYFFPEIEYESDEKEKTKRAKYK